MLDRVHQWCITIHPSNLVASFLVRMMKNDVMIDQLVPFFKPNKTYLCWEGGCLEHPFALLLWKQWKQNPGLENPSLRTKMVITDYPPREKFGTPMD
jgi:hypothetical protein